MVINLETVLALCGLWFGFCVFVAFWLAWGRYWFGALLDWFNPPIRREPLRRKD